MTHVVTDNCRHCRFTNCVESCPVACFHSDEARVYIDPAVCIDCGACIPTCPVWAIVEEIDLADDQMHWLETNARESRRTPVIRQRSAPLPGADDRRQALGF